jgi:outer membrane receptor for ferrienterochelin and colicins
MKLEPVAGLVIQPGGRVSYNSRYAAPLVYSLNLKWAPLENYTFRASYSRGFRAPSLKELYLMFVDVNHNVRGNEDLKAEYSHNFNFSAGYNHEKGHHVYSADLACFYNKIDNIISLANVEGNLYSYINIDKFNSMGAQLNLVYRYYPALSLKAGVSHTGRKNELLTSGVQPAFKYSTDFVFESSYTWLKSGLTLSAFYKYTGRLPQFYTASDGSLVEGFISDFNNLDISAVKSLWKNRISITAGARNIFDIKSVDAMGGNGGAHTGDGSGSVPVGWGRSYFIKFALHLYQFEKENVKQ